MYDILIKNGKVIDGTGSDAYAADVAVKDGKIVKIGELADAQAAQVIDAAGRFVTPGFIDMHSHGDCSAPAFPEMESAINQGITTIFAGHCGMGAVPVGKYWNFNFYESPAFDRAFPPPIGGHQPVWSEYIETEKLRPHYKEVFGVDIDWDNMDTFFEHMEKAGMGINLVCVAAHGLIRQQVMGKDAEREATAAEIEEMKKLVHDAMKGGAWGMSLGLDYRPGVFASHEELVELTKCLKPYGGTLTTHCQRRDFRYGVTKKQYYINGIKEVCEIAKEAGVHLHISHIVKGYDVAPPDDRMLEAAARATIDVINDYRAQGVHITWDVLPPMVDGAVFYFPQLIHRMRPYLDECGGITPFLARLKIGSYKADLIKRMKAGQHASKCWATTLDPVSDPDWDKRFKITRCTNKAYEGRTIREIAEESGKHFVDVIFDIVEQDPQTCCGPAGDGLIPRVYSVDNEFFMKQEDSCIGLDDGVYNMDSAVSLPDMPLECGSPETYCGIVRFLVRDTFPRFEDAVRRVTGNAAAALGLRGRGLLREGYAADIVVVDRENLDPNLDVADPRQVVKGLDYVIVNGKVAAERGRQLHAASGKPIRLTENK